MGAATKTPSPSKKILRLEQGDRLSGPEFLRRYEAMPELKKAELIDGVVYMPSPVSAENHGEQHATTMFWLTCYHVWTPGVRMFDNTTVQLDLENIPQPDGLVLIDPHYGGQAFINADGYVENGPELAAEVTASSVSYDLGVKMQMYRRHKVREYVVWRVYDHAIDWFSLRRSKYEPLQPDAQGILRSKVFPGLWMDPAAMMRHDHAAILRLLQQGCATPEHAAFVAKLQHAAGSSL
jgi:hypothetical protein